MIKSIAFIRRKAGVSREEFQRHYEEIHAPMGQRLLPGLKGYVRNYPQPRPGMPEPDFDVVTEFWYDSMEAIRQVHEFLATPAAQPLLEDERTFIDSASIRAYIFETHGSERL